ncbi:hypothetical protein ACQY0O_008179 [Thecaphora frezii]
MTLSQPLAPQPQPEPQHRTQPPSSQPLLPPHADASSSRHLGVASPPTASQALRDPLSDVESVVFEPYPSPALSAYSSYSSSSSVDFSDLDSDLGSLSLDAIDEPLHHHHHSHLRHHHGHHTYHHPQHDNGLAIRTDSGAPQEQQQQQQCSGGPPSAQCRARDASGEQHLSGTSTPIATASSSFLGRNGSTPAQDSSYTHRSLSPQEESPDRPERSGAATPHPADRGAGEDEQQLELEGDDDDGFDLLDANEDDMHAEGIPAARGWRLDARQADSPKFWQKVLDLFSTQLQLYGWSPETADPALLPLRAEHLHLKRISGAFTNAVFFASYQPEPRPTGATLPPTVLLRVYGSGSEALLSRRAELLILHTLSSLYEIGPHILGTFANGRVEEFYECDPIQKEGMRDLGNREARIVAGGSLKIKGHEGRAHWVARRMNELHAVPLEVMKTVLEQGDLKAPGEKGFGRGIQDHIMASSHRPRRKLRHKPSNPANLGLGGAAPGAPGSPHVFALDGRNAMRASPAPMMPSELPAAHEAAEAPAVGGGSRAYPYGEPGSAGYYSHRNSSVASLDSLATSYDSQSSFSSSYSPSLHGYGSPSMGISSHSGTAQSSSSTASSYFASTAAKSSMASPFVPASQRQRRLSSSSGSARGPYPGVWRRMKRWSREAAKVVQLVESFARSESGSKAIAVAFAGYPSIKEEMEAASRRAVGGADSADGAEAGARGLTTETIGPSPGSLRNTLRCMRALDLASMVKELDEFKHFVRKWERREGPSKRVFAHNDAQYGNLLVIKSAAGGGGSGGGDEFDNFGSGAAEAAAEPASIPAGMPRHAATVDRQHRGSVDSDATASPTMHPARAASRSRTRKASPPHHKLVVIDFEYACPNPRAYDIANHFQEWRADYHHPTLSWSLRHHGAYPDQNQRRKWLRAYVEQGRLVRMRGRALGLDSLPPPTEMALPPSVVSSHSSQAVSSRSSVDSGYGAAASDKHDSRASQFGALETSLGGSGKPPGPGARTPSAHLLQSGTEVNTPTAGAEPPSVEAAAAAMLSGPSADPEAKQHAAAEPNPASSWQAGLATPTSLPAVSSGGGNGGSEVPMSPQTLALARLDASIEREIDRLEREIRVWSPATHAVWGLWGIVFAKEEVESVLSRAVAEIEAPAELLPRESVLRNNAPAKLHEAGSAESFDNLRYALGRFELFREEFRQLKAAGIDAI